MRRSLLFNLHSHKIRPGVEADPNKFQEVFRSKYGKVRIFKLLGVSEESKKWVADPANRVCDVPGSWFCPGQYPPGLSEILAKKKDFSQLEDFNRKQDDEEYQRAYFEALNNPELARKRAMEREEERKYGDIPRDLTGKPDQAVLDMIYSTYDDTEATTRMWALINSNNVAELRVWLESLPAAAYIRSKDGRGPMWWAFEKMNQDVVSLLTEVGVPSTDTDANGVTPLALLKMRVKLLPDDEIDKINAFWQEKINTPTPIVATFLNSGGNFDQAELYYGDTFWSKLGKNDPPVSVNTYEKHNWNVKVGGLIVKSFTMSLENGEKQSFTV